MKTINSLLAQRAQIDLEIASIRAGEKRDAIHKIKAIAKKHNLTEKEMLAAVKTGATRRAYPKVEPKFRNPYTGATWAGRGHRPHWMMAPNAEVIFAIK